MPSARPDLLHVASSNAGKLRDFSAAAKLIGVAIEPLPGLDSIPAPPEDEPTFEANARSKAEYYSRCAPGLWVLADDSGLEVDALDGAPGVRSARFAADSGFKSSTIVSPDALNNAYLLERLSNAPSPLRTALYRCALAVARDGVTLHTSEGTVGGLIMTAPRGAGGFGYDPLFWLPSLNKSMAEIDLATKQSLSHRGRALRKLLEDWR
jgi:XTP/dITP diphosphohydrolase